MRRTATVAIAIATILAGCGGEDAPDLGDLGNEAAEAAWECLADEGFEVVGGRSDASDRDAPDVELIVRSGNVPIFVGYYASEREAESREHDLFEAVAPQAGTVLVRGAVAVVTGGLPDAEDKATVEGCVF